MLPAERVGPSFVNAISAASAACALQVGTWHWILDAGEYLCETGVPTLEPKAAIHFKAPTLVHSQQNTTQHQPTAQPWYRSRKTDVTQAGTAEGGLTPNPV